METKVCTGKCRQELPLSAFAKGRGYKGGYRSECKVCAADRLKAWREANRDKHQAQWTRSNERRKASYENTPQRQVMARDAYLRRTYGITVEDEHRMHEAQGGRCACCGEEKRLVVDHNHKTGAVRGLLCNACNVVLGLVNDDTEHLRKLVVYVENR